MCRPLCKYNEWFCDSWELVTIIIPHCFDSTIFYSPISTSTRPGLFLSIRVGRTRRVDEVLNGSLTFKRVTIVVCIYTIYHIYTKYLREIL